MTPVAVVPRINIQAFCDTAQSVEAVQAAFADRRMARAHGSAMTGGIPAAVRLYQTQSSPNLLIVETSASRETLLADLAALAEVCQPDTKVIIIGHVNDVVLYRELIRQGISEYVVAPVHPLQLVDTISSLYRSERAAPIGRVVAFMGVKGGTGSSTICHNVAWEMARSTGIETTIVDLDLAFGTASLDFNFDITNGILEAIDAPERVDALLLDRLIVKLGDKLSLLGGLGGVDRDLPIEANAVETILTAMRTSIPMILVDVPSQWSPWVKFTLLHADQIVLTCEPELASLRNAKALVDMLKASRPNDPPPVLVLNQVGVPKRPEITNADFKKAIGIDSICSIPFDAQNFGIALNNGRMMIDMSPKAKAADAIRKLARDLVGERSVKPATKSQSIVNKFLALGRR